MTGPTTPKPGASEGDHTHGGDADGRPLEEIYYFLSGHGMMRIAGEEVAVAPGDAIMVPPVVDHGLVIGDGRIREEIPLGRRETHDATPLITRLAQLGL